MHCIDSYLKYLLGITGLKTNFYLRLLLDFKVADPTKCAVCDEGIFPLP